MVYCREALCTKTTRSSLLVRGLDMILTVIAKVI